MPKSTKNCNKFVFKDSIVEVFITMITYYVGKMLDQ